MNRLPNHRSALWGRTFSRSWSASDYDPIESYSRQIVKFSDLGMVVLAVVFVVLMFWGFA
jgi:hypothetical protein